MAICKKQHRYLEGFNELPKAQDNKYGGRHICAACAYEEGLNDALQGNSPQSDLLIYPIVKQVLYVTRVLLTHIFLAINMVKKSVLNKSTNLIRYIEQLPNIPYFTLHPNMCLLNSRATYFPWLYSPHHHIH